MASREGDSRGRENAVRALLYVPCPACTRAVRLTKRNRVPDEPDAYDCPHCGARFYLSAD